MHNRRRDGRRPPANASAKTPGADALRGRESMGRILAHRVSNRLLRQVADVRINVLAAAFGIGT